MSLTPSAAPKPLPTVPCPTFDGKRINWEAWTKASTLTHVDQSCSSCAYPAPLSLAAGVSVPNPGDTFDASVGRRLKSGRRYWQTVQRPAHPVRRLLAFLCPQCYTLDFLAMAKDGDLTGAVPTILCDGCDRLCGVGGTFEEARVNLVQLGGWTASGDWDLCPECSPTGEAPVSLRAAHGGEG